MCTKNGSICENEKQERKIQGGGRMCTKNGSYCEKEKKSGGGGRGQGRCERRSEAFVKIHFFFFGGGGGGGRVGGGGGTGCM